MRKIRKKIIIISALFGSLLFLPACSLRADVTYSESEYATDAIKINQIELTDEEKNIYIKKSNDQKIRITYSENNKLSYHFKVSNEGRLSITSKEKKDWKDYVGLKERQTMFVEIQIPENTTTDLTIKSTKGDVTINDITIDGALKVETKNGKISGENFLGQKGMELKAKKGDITAKIAGKYQDFQIQSRVSKGKNNLPIKKEKGSKKLQIEVDEGNAKITFKK